MVTNGRVIQIMGHASEALGVCASQEASVNPRPRHSLWPGSKLRRGVREEGVLC